MTENDHLNFNPKSENQTDPELSPQNATEQNQGASFEQGNLPAGEDTTAANGQDNLTTSSSPISSEGAGWGNPRSSEANLGPDSPTPGGATSSDWNQANPLPDTSTTPGFPAGTTVPSNLPETTSTANLTPSYPSTASNSVNGTQSADTSFAVPDNSFPSNLTASEPTYGRIIPERSTPLSPEEGENRRVFIAGSQNTPATGTYQSGAEGTPISPDTSIPDSSKATPEGYSAPGESWQTTQMGSALGSTNTDTTPGNSYTAALPSGASSSESFPAGESGPNGSGPYSSSLPNTTQIYPATFSPETQTPSSQGEYVPTTLANGSGGGTQTETPRKVKVRRGPGWFGTIAIAAAAGLMSWGIPHVLENGTTSIGSSGAIVATEAPVVQADAQNTNWETVAETVQPSVVAIQVSSDSESDTGSGVIFDQSGHILTNYHVVASAITGDATVQVELYDGTIYDANVVGADSSTDLAVLEFASAKPDEIQMASLGDSSDLQVAEPVAAIGSPLGLENTITTGIISALDRPVTVVQESTTDSVTQGGLQIPGQTTTSSADLVITNAIQVDAAINPGNSGGPLFNASGQVIGITSSIASVSSSSYSSTQSGSIGIGFAIPINLAKNVANQILTTGTVEHAFLGVTIQTGIASSTDGKSQLGALITSVVSGSPAESAGLQTDDLIIGIDDYTVSSGTALTGYVRWYNPGDKVTLTVIRDGEEKTIEATLGSDADTSTAATEQGLTQQQEQAPGESEREDPRESNQLPRQGGQ